MGGRESVCGKRLSVCGRGFTLIELLVVIAIIAVIAAIIFPVFSRTREMARQTTCMSNLRQLALGIDMYAEDWGGCLPSTWGGPPPPPNCDGGAWDPNHPNDWDWQQIIQPYTGSVQIALCPDVSVCTNLFGTNRVAGNLSTYGPFLGHYGMNIALALLSQSAVVHPTNTLELCDCGDSAFLGRMVGNTSAYIPGFGSLPGAVRVPSLDPALRSDFMNGRHNGGVNGIFADGHARWMTASQMAPDAETASLNSANHTKNPDMFDVY